MKVALLAAGLGSRLGALTAAAAQGAHPGRRTHPAGARPRLRRPAVAHRGHRGGRVRLSRWWRRSCEQLRRAGGLVGPALPITLVENRDFRQGNLLSLQAARPHLDDGFVLLNVDHIFRPSIAALVAAPADFVTAFIDTDRTLGADDMKVKRDPQGRVARIAKTLTDFDAGYVGMTRVPATALDRYFAETDAALAHEGSAIHVERVLARLADGRRSRPTAATSAATAGWR